MDALIREHLSELPGVRFAALAPRENHRLLNAEPWGVPVERLVAEEEPGWCEQYLRLNHHAFSRLPLARWVLSDLYLLPGAIGLFTGPASYMDEKARVGLGASPQTRVILAAYVGAPSLQPGRFIGVSLMSFAQKTRVGAFVKALTLKMLGATSVRGVAQWSNPSVRVHTRLGPLRIVGRVPGGHDLSDQSFVYDCELRDEDVLRRCMTREWKGGLTHAVAADDRARLGQVLDGAERGERHVIVPPGLDEEGRIVFAREEE